VVRVRHHARGRIGRVADVAALHVDPLAVADVGDVEADILRSAAEEAGREKGKRENKAPEAHGDLLTFLRHRVKGKSELPLVPEAVAMG
jgi:hypothetical protein